MHFRRSLRFTLLCALILASCKAGGRNREAGREPAPRDEDPEEPSSGELDTTGFNLVVVTDVSQSMKENDEEGFNRQGAQLAVALANVTDNIGLVAFNSGIEAKEELQAMSSARRRKRLDKRIEGLENLKATDYLAALEAAEDVLRPAGSSRKSAIIFLSDGDHDPRRLFQKTNQEEERDQIRSRARAFGENETHLYTIAFTDKFVPELMQDMAVVSGGAYYAVEEPADLLDAYLEVLGDVYELFQYTKDATDLAVEPITRRLVYVLIKERADSNAHLKGRIERDGVPVDFGDAMYHRPPSREDYFDVVQFSGDLTGRWTADVARAEGRVVLLSQVPISFRIVPGSPAPQYEQGADQAFEVEALCEDEELAIAALERVEVEVRCETASSSGDPILLRPRREGRTLRFMGTSVAAMLDPESVEEEQQDVFFSIKLGEGWTHTKQKTTRIVKPAKPLPKGVLAFRQGGLETSSVDLGEFWRGAVAPSETLEIENTHDTAVRVSFEADGLVQAPRTTDVPAGGSIEVPLQLAGTPPVGTSRATLRCVASALSGEAELKAQEVDVRLTVFDLNLTVPRTAVAPGTEQTLTFEAEVQPAGRAMTLTVDELEAAPGLSLDPWPATVEGPFELRASAPEIAQGGRYRATLSLAPAGSSLAPRTFPFELSLAGSKALVEVAPEELSLEVSTGDWRGKDEWVSLDDVLVTLTHHKSLPFEFSFTDLTSDSGATITKFDLKGEPSDGVLESGQPQRLILQIFVRENMAVGVYSGSVKIDVQVGDGPDDWETSERPVVIEVKR